MADQQLGPPPSRRVSGAGRATTTRGALGLHPPTISLSASGGVASAAVSWTVRGTPQPQPKGSGKERSGVLTRLHSSAPLAVLRLSARAFSRVSSSTYNLKLACEQSGGGLAHLPGEWNHPMKGMEGVHTWL
jgi:hypothetical protein|mmetsp:Transcript_10668/g.17099  ORF Transcript_10668/g.17099 Transcript_10668/m.17099 type:complete len:132 (-) Transcript_10668:563-958(-)